MDKRFGTSNVRSMYRADSLRAVVEEISEYTGCPGKNVPYVGNVFLMLKYADITQNTYVKSYGDNGPRT
jgi:hypothetical protein